MNKRRLLKLADLLEADAKNKKGIKFDLSTWGDIGDASKPISCGTVACAMGLAVASNAFARAGLESYRGGADLTPKFDGKIGFDAAEALFEISGAAADFLFSDHQYPLSSRRGAVGERVVAKRIRDFVAGKVTPTSLID